MTDVPTTGAQPAAKPPASLDARLASVMPALIALLIVLIFAVVLVGAVWAGDGPLITQLIETLKYAVVAVIGFYLGSAVSSRQKDTSAASALDKLADKA